MGSSHKFTPKKREKFLESLAITGNVSKSAEAIGMMRRWMYQKRAGDEFLVKDCDQALELDIDYQ